MSKKWDVAAQMYRPIDAARVAVVGEELGTQRALTVPPIPIAYGTSQDDHIARLEAEIAQQKRYNADLYEMARARGAEVERLREQAESKTQCALLYHDAMKQLRDTRAEVEQLRVAAEETGSGQTAPDNSAGAVKRRVEGVIDDLLSGRTTPDQRRGLGTATERAGRVTSGSDGAIGRISRGHDV